MCELGVFSIFLENDLSKVDKIPGLTFFMSRKDFDGFKTAFFFHSTVAEFFARWNAYNSRSIIAYKRPFCENFAQSLFITNKNEKECLQKFYVSSKYM